MRKLITIVAIVLAIFVPVLTVYKIQQDKEASEIVESYVADLQGATEQDIRLCRLSYINGGKYYHHFNDVKLTCKRHSIEVERDHTNE